MTKTHARVSQYAEELISVPRAHLRLELHQDENGLTLRHEGETLVECSLTREGMMAAGFMAEALGAKIPPIGQSVALRVSTGVLYRAIAIPGLDLSKEESYVILERLLDEAELQRAGSSDAV